MRHRLNNSEDVVNSFKMESTQRKLPPNPREHANFLSKLFMIFTVPFFKKGFEKELSFDNVFEPLICDKSETLGNRLEK